MTTSTGETRVEIGDGEERRRDIPADTFAARVMLARMHAGYQTIDEAAAKCGLTRQNWSNWEKGMRPRDLLEVVDAISAGLGVDANWLLRGGPLAKPAPVRRGEARRRMGLGQGRAAQIMAGGDVTTQYYGQSGTPRRRPLDSRPAGHPGGVRRPERLTPPIAA